MYLKEIGKNRSPYNISSNGVDGIAAAFNWREAWVVHYNTCSSSAIYLVLFDIVEAPWCAECKVSKTLGQCDGGTKNQSL